MARYIGVGSKDIKVEAHDVSVSAALAIERATKTGYMTKQGAQNTRSWQRRYFALHNNCLFYYTSTAPNSCVGMVWLEGCEVVSGGEDEEKDGGWRLQIMTCGGREYVLKCDTAEERNDWVLTLNGSQYHVINDKHSELHESHTELQSTLDQVRGELDSAAASAKEHKDQLDQVQAAQQLRDEALAQLEEEKALLQARSRQLEEENGLLVNSRGVRMLPVDPARQPPRPSQEVAHPDNPPTRIWVGSWNVGAAEPFESTGMGSAPRLLRETLLRESDPCDVYFLGLQEGISDAVFHATEGVVGVLADCVRVPLSDGHGHGKAQAEDKEGHLRDRINGRGDGSLMGTKFTGAALYVRRPLLGSDVKLIGCVAHPLEKLGSKGGVAVGLNIRGTTIVFVTCHLEANKNDARRAQYKELVAHLGALLGERDADLTTQFHHVVWCGDLNYRCVGLHGEPLASEEVIEALKRGENGSLFDNHDQLNQERRHEEVFVGFHEAKPLPDFYPTYKKFEQRGSTDYSLSTWPQHVYRTKYKEPIYKGGNVKERTPGYCDRILYHSVEDRSHQLTPDKAVYSFEYLRPSDAPVVPGGGEVQEGLFDNYAAVNDGEGMSVSDHSPVYGTFTLDRRPESHHSPRGTIEVSDFAIHAGDLRIPPAHVDVVFPAPFEVEDGASHVRYSTTSPAWAVESTKSSSCKRFGSDDPQPPLQLTWDSTRSPTVSTSSTSGSARLSDVEASDAVVPLENLHLIVRVSCYADALTGAPAAAQHDAKAEVFSGNAAVCLTYFSDPERSEQEPVSVQLRSHGKIAAVPGCAPDDRRFVHVSFRLRVTYSDR